MTDTPMTRAEVLDLVAKARAAGQRANLRGANLWGANLQGADLWGADLQRADLRGANLWGADDAPAILMVTGLPSGDASLAPWADGWELRVGWWTGTPDSLAELIATDEGWPEAEGDECARRCPGLEALIVQCRAWMAAHPQAVEQAVAAQVEGERIRAEVRNA